jgi:hypothetical protein
MKNIYFKTTRQMMVIALILSSFQTFGQFQSLTCIKTNVQNGYYSILQNFPQPYSFAYDGGNNYISDGGGDMYDDGNYLNTEVIANILYTSGVITPSTAFGTNGTYFTLELPGLFMLAADLDGLNQFYITGNNGADGGGFVDIHDFQITYDGQTYNVYTKRVYGAGDPSINHMFIIPSSSSVIHNFSSDTNNDFDEISGLVNTPRLYYVLFSTQGGSMVTNSELENTAQAFIELAEGEGAAITAGLNASYCPGASLAINFDLCDFTPVAGNTFTLELSDASGSFASPTVLTSAASTTPVVLNAVLPMNLLGSANYKLRVNTSQPSSFGIASKKFMVKETPQFDPISVCIGSDTLLVEQNDQTLAWYATMGSSSPIEITNEFLLSNVTTSTSLFPSFANMTLETFTGLNVTDFAAVDHDAQSGDDRGGIAVNKDYLYVVGDDNTARMRANDLSELTSLPLRDGIFSDLSTGKLYDFYNTTEDANIYDWGLPFTVEALMEMDDDLNYTGNMLTLSQPIDINYYYYNGMFAGSGFLIFYEYDASEWYHISLIDGTVTNIGTNQLPDLYGSENWADWGFATINGTDTMVYYRDGSADDIVGMNVNTGAITLVYSFNDISDMSSITYSPWHSRLYFHHEYESEFISSSYETAGYIGGSHTGSYIADVAACRSEVEIIAIDCQNSLDELSANSIKLYPNPVTEMLQVELQEMVGSYELLIYDLSGRVVYSRKSNDLVNNIDVKNFNSGYYVVKVRTSTFETTRSFIKN